MESLEQKQYMLNQWFTRVSESLYKVDNQINAIDINDPSRTRYQNIIDMIDNSVHNLGLIEKIINNDVILKGYNQKLINKVD